MKLSHSIRGIIPLVFAYVFLFVSAVPVVAEMADGQTKTDEPASAVTMQLMKIEGDVSITNNRGKSISFLEKMRLYNGYHVETQEESYAWINLDSTKLTKLDAASELEVRKDGNNLEILLNSGSLFFNVTEPLADDETLKVRTSTMTVGIRGTCGWVKVTDRGDTRVYILEGTVGCGVTDPVTGQTKETDLNGGEMADFLVYSREQEGDKCDIIRYGFTEDDIDGFVLVEAVQDEELCQKIYEASGLDLMACADEAEERLKADQEEMHKKLLAAEEQLAQQENNVSVDPVWNGDIVEAGVSSAIKKAPAQVTVNDGNEAGTAVTQENVEEPKKPVLTENSSSVESEEEESFGESDYSGDSESSDGEEDEEVSDEVGGEEDNGSADSPADPEMPGGADSSTGTETPAEPETPSEPDNQAEFKLIMPDVDSGKIADALAKYETARVLPSNDPSENILNLDSSLTVPAGRTLIIESGINTINGANGQVTLQVDGTMNVYGDLENGINGKLVVNSSNTLNVKSKLTNSGTILNNSSGRIVVGDKLVMSDGELDNSGIIEGDLECVEAKLNITDGVIGAVNVTGSSEIKISGGSVDHVEGVSGDIIVSGGKVDRIECSGSAGIKISGGEMDGVYGLGSIHIDGGKIKTLMAGGRLTMTAGEVDTMEHRWYGSQISGGTIGRLLNTSLFLAIQGAKVRTIEHITSHETILEIGEGTIVEQIISDASQATLDIKAGASVKVLSHRTGKVTVSGNVDRLEYEGGSLTVESGGIITTLVNNNGGEYTNNGTIENEEGPNGNSDMDQLPEAMEPEPVTSEEDGILAEDMETEELGKEEQSE